MEKKINFTLGQLSILFLAIAVVSGKLTPNYDADDSYKLFKMGKNLTLQCKPENAADGAKIVWEKDGQDVSKIAALSGHYERKDKEGIFKIPKALEEHAGNYTCTLGGESHRFEAWARVVVKIPTNSYVVENEKAEIICIVKGTDPKITWKFVNKTEDYDKDDFVEIDENSERYDLQKHDDVENSKLILKSALMSDRGTFKCIGTSKVMEDRNIEDEEVDDEDHDEVKHISIGMLRVKDKLAALWPFLGICAEVFILCTIILIYEKRRNKTEDDESDTDQSPDHRKK